MGRYMVLSKLRRDIFGTLGDLEPSLRVFVTQVLHNYGECHHRFDLSVEPRPRAGINYRIVVRVDAEDYHKCFGVCLDVPYGENALEHDLRRALDRELGADAARHVEVSVILE